MYALSENGMVYAWGSNEWHQIKPQEDIDKQYDNPVLLAGLSDIVDIGVNVYPEDNCTISGSRIRGAHDPVCHICRQDQPDALRRWCGSSAGWRTASRVRAGGGGPVRRKQSQGS